jgi:flagellar biosynthesis/type III secretory pathway protein FliH
MTTMTHEEAVDAAYDRGWEDGHEDGERDGRRDAESDAADVLHELNLHGLAADLTALVIEYRERMGTALTAPDEHERRLSAVRDALVEAVAR